MLQLPEPAGKSAQRPVGPIRGVLHADPFVEKFVANGIGSGKVMPGSRLLSGIEPVAYKRLEGLGLRAFLVRRTRGLARQVSVERSSKRIEPEYVQHCPHGKEVAAHLFLRIISQIAASGSEKLVCLPDRGKDDGKRR